MKNKNTEHDYMPTMFIWLFIYLFVMYIISVVFNLSNTASILLGLPPIIICGGYSIAFVIKIFKELKKIDNILF